MSACIVYSKCRIQFKPNNRQHAERNYSDRSSIELRQHDFTKFSLRALDIDHNKEEIFDISLKQENQYEHGGSADIPDKIRSNDGTYHLWLNESSRDGFYKELRQTFEQLRKMSQSDAAVQSSNEENDSDEDNDSDYNNEGSDISDGDHRVKPDIPDPTVISPKDLLLDVHHLGKYIAQGDAKAAALAASQLASHGIRLQANSSKKAQNENEFTIHVQLDGNEYGVDQHGAKIPVDVFQSTTVRELRAIFEFAYQYPPSNQYFFVNGCLAHDNLTMQNLNVGPNSLFVLFLLTHPRTFTRNGPWECSACKINNQQNNLRCTACSAARTN